jgi:hypothetical protein
VRSGDCSLDPVDSAMIRSGLLGVSDIMDDVKVLTTRHTAEAPHLFDDLEWEVIAQTREDWFDEQDEEYQARILSAREGGVVGPYW